MVILEEGLNAIRDLVNTNVGSGQLGTSGVAAAITQTDLLSGDATTIKGLSKTASSKQLTFSYTLLTTEGVSGNTYREFKLFDSGTADYDRIVFTGVTKTDSKSINLVKRYFFKNV